MTPTPLVAALLGIVDAERARIAELRAEIASSREPARVLELQRAIERVKRESETERLRVQIGFARREGRIAVAERLERMLAAMGSPGGARVSAPASR